MRKHRLSTSLAVSAVAAGAVLGTALGTATWAGAFDQQQVSGHPVVHQATPTVAVSAPPVHQSVISAAPVTAPTQQAVASSSVPSGGGGSLAALRQCESGGNYSTNTGNGYYGAYQFTQQAWASVGMSGSPASAAPAQQDAAAQRLQAQQGWGPWPACSAKLGLR